MKFYLDADLSPKIAELLRKRGVDALSAWETGNAELSDREQLAYAAGEGRCLVTKNARDFLGLSREAFGSETPHAGIVICPPSIRGFEFAAIAEALIRVAGLYPEGPGDYDALYL